MLNGTLKDLVLGVEKGETNDWPIWISVSGSLISGSLVSHRKMVHQTTELLFQVANIVDQAELIIGSDLLAEKDEEYSQMISEVKNAHLTKVTIFHGDKIVHSPFAIIDLNAVGAWGVGQFHSDN